MKAKTYKKWQIALGVLLAFFLVLLAFATTLAVGSAIVDRDARTLPSYPRVDLAPILAKDRAEWTDADYETLSRQTGILSRQVLGTISPSSLPEFQNALFFEGELAHETVAVTTPRDILLDPETGKSFTAPIVPLEPGDVLVSSVCHTYGWRNGHAALILKGSRLLHSASLGYDSQIVNTASSSGVTWFRRGANFMVLRLKDADEALRTSIAETAERSLAGIPYSLTVGIFSPKDQGYEPAGTNCSHLVWQAFRYYGYDIDSDGGPVCTVRDIANCPDFEVVQAYGFDLDRLWG